MKAALAKLQGILVAYGPWGIFLLSVADSFGAPLPGAMDFLLVGIAAASASNPRHAYFTALLAVIGSLAGNIGLYMAARRGAGWMIKREPPPGRSRRFREWFHRYGLLTVFIPAVTPVVPLPLKFFVISSGALRAPFGRFLLVILLARVIRYFGEAYLGLQVGEEGAKRFLAQNGWTLALVAAGMVAIMVVLIRRADRRRRADDSDSSGPANVL